jgi:hypothetical protein
MWQLPEGIVKQVGPHPDWHLTNSCHSEDRGRLSPPARITSSTTN